MCYFFDPRDLWNSKNFSIHGIRCCIMESPVCSHCLCFQCEGFVSNTWRRDSGVFLCSKGRLGWKSTRFWKLHCLTKIALQSRHLTQNWWSWCHFVGKLMFYQIKLKNNSVTSTLFMKLTIKVVYMWRCVNMLITYKWVSCSPSCQEERSKWQNFTNFLQLSLCALHSHSCAEPFNCECIICNE